MTPQTQKPHPAEREAAFRDTLHTNFKRFPPFGKQLDQIRQRGLIPNRRVIVCFDWQIGKLYPRIVIMREHPPERIELRYLAGLHCQIAFFDHDAEYLPGLVDEILKTKPASLALFNMSAVQRGEPAFSMVHKEAAA